MRKSAFRLGGAFCCIMENTAIKQLMFDYPYLIPI